MIPMHQFMTYFAFLQPAPLISTGKGKRIWHFFSMHAKCSCAHDIAVGGGEVRGVRGGWKGVIAWRKNLSQDYCTQFCGEILQLARQ